MENSTEDKIDIKNKTLFFLKNNKKKLLTVIFISLFIIISLIYYKNHSEIKNNLISEKYVQAGLYLATNKNDQSKKLYEEIILSKNKFYSILSLNRILEKKLESDKNKILNYFTIVENLAVSKDEKDLIYIKKALYLIDAADIDDGKLLLQRLIDTNSKYQSLSREILEK